MRPLPLAVAMVEINSDFGPEGGCEASTAITHGNNMVGVLGVFSLGKD